MAVGKHTLQASTTASASRPSPMSFGLRGGQLGCLDVTSPLGWPMSPRPPPTRRPHTVPTMPSSGRGRRPLSVFERPAWDYSSTKTNRTQAMEYTRVKTKAGPSLFNRHEVHQNFYYETRPAIHEMSAGLTERLKAGQKRAEATVYSSRFPTRTDRKLVALRGQQPRSPRSGNGRSEEHLDQEGAVNQLFWTITDGRLPEDVDKMWRRPKVGKFAWSV